MFLVVDFPFCFRERWKFQANPNCGFVCLFINIYVFGDDVFQFVIVYVIYLQLYALMDHYLYLYFYRDIKQQHLYPMLWAPSIPGITGIYDIPSIPGFLQIVKFGWNCEIWSKLKNLVKIVKFGRNCEIWLNPITLVLLRFGLEGWMALNLEQSICRTVSQSQG